MKSITLTATGKFNKRVTERNTKMYLIFFFRLTTFSFFFLTMPDCAQTPDQKKKRRKEKRGLSAIQGDYLLPLVAKTVPGIMSFSCESDSQRGWRRRGQSEPKLQGVIAKIEPPSCRHCSQNYDCGKLPFSTVTRASRSAPPPIQNHQAHSSLSTSGPREGKGREGRPGGEEGEPCGFSE